MRSFENIIDEVFTALKEVKGSDRFWVEVEVKEALNDAYTEIADELGCFSETAIIEMKANVRTYKLPENYIMGSLKRVEFDGEEIFPLTVRELGKNWRNTTAALIENYILDLGASDEIVVYPMPSQDGAAYNVASESKDQGVVTTVENDSYEDFNMEDGVITTVGGEEVKFDETEGFGPVLDLRDTENNIQVFYAKYPKRLSANKEVFLHPITYNPRKVLTKGAMSLLLLKEGEGKDVIKASTWRVRFEEAMKKLDRPRTNRVHQMKSITEGASRGKFNLGSHYPSYFG